MNSQLIMDALKRIRESEELGAGSCSVIDECREDSEVIEEILDVLAEKPLATVEEIFQDVLSWENTFRAIERDIQNA